MSNRHYSSRENARADKARTKSGYQPPPIETMKYKIVDNRFHGTYYFRLKKNFIKKVREFKKLPDFDGRFIIIPNY